jgi:protein TonB
MLAAVLAFLMQAAPQAPATSPAPAAQPAASQPLRYYPEAAQKLGVEGDVTLDCQATPAGRLEDCKLLSETPQGYGFGDTALQLAPSFQLNAGTPGGELPKGRVIVPMNFRLPH